MGCGAPVVQWRCRACRSLWRRRIGGAQAPKMWRRPPSIRGLASPGKSAVSGRLHLAGMQTKIRLGGLGRSRGGQQGGHLCALEICNGFLEPPLAGVRDSQSLVPIRTAYSAYKDQPPLFGLYSIPASIFLHLPQITQHFVGFSLQHPGGSSTLRVAHTIRMLVFGLSDDNRSPLLSRRFQHGLRMEPNQDACQRGGVSAFGSHKPTASGKFSRR
jgi:hypothetical protein